MADCLSGHCHCGGVVFELRAPIVELTTCDCSLCAMRRAVMTKVQEDALFVIQGEDLLTLYQWNTHRAKHYFCKVCGIYLFHRKRAQPDHLGVNVLCLSGIDPNAFPVRATDGLTMSVASSDAPAHWRGPREPI